MGIREVFRQALRGYVDTGPTRSPIPPQTLSDHFQEIAFEIARFWHGQKYWMVQGLTSGFQNPQLASVGLSRPEQHGVEEVLAQVVGTRAGYQHPTRRQGPEGA
jgi:hypothetical protein